MGTRRAQLRVLLACALLLGASPGFASGESHRCPLALDYYLQIDPAVPGAVVRIAATDVRHDSLVFVMPGWTPGAYEFRGHWDNVADVAAVSGGRSLAVAHPNPERWLIATQGCDRIEFTYRVHSLAAGFGIGGQGDTFASVNGPSTFMYAGEHRNRRITLHVAAPEGWRIATALPGGAGDEFTAPSYDYLVDSPLEIGVFTGWQFILENRPVQVVLRGKAALDTTAFLRMVYDVTRYQTRFFGEIPFDKYVFLFAIDPAAGNMGLEHANSANITLSPFALSENFLRVAEITAHEFFHLWNVKRIRPREFAPIDYTRPARTHALWFCEGVTSYYAELTLLRIGQLSETAFLRKISDEIYRLLMTPERHTASVAEASWNLWDTGYAGDGVSIYNKGFLLGLLLDLRLRWETGNRAGLDDVLRELNQRFGRTGDGYTGGAIREAAARVAGRRVDDFFRAYVFGVDDLPFKEYLGFAGLRYARSRVVYPHIGEFRVSGPQNVLASLETGGPAARAGLQPGDAILAVDGRQVKSQRELNAALAARRPGETLHVLVRREGQNRTFRLKVDALAIPGIELRRDASPSVQQQRVWQGLVSGSTR